MTAAVSLLILALVGPASARLGMAPLTAPSAAQDDAVIQVRGGHGHGHGHGWGHRGRGHHYGWGRGRHYGWYRGHHYGWRHHHRYWR
ncbi:hypothetical protein XH93_23815 [Bradyrhizobium sp. CCBAU 51753]|nr:hypothetical protein XH93_23815 [Bradyrhizobium sp. CCBAU 51753]